ncbi:unnamed protein product [Tilletia controversa]|uniref:Uncharacterized protein n=3 Tax=Tilletia TaxID=13289 RepID=A0A8X7MTB3_9BASI|nr:hypothetical protein CF336_g3640 [Tilletia laevis]KAE8199135.1 hypothetical protein CF328_g3337 [Tilletia controversa]KAE8261705.1 hypothetical protein A4X03_0g3030 [Tilletia caries]KAE8203857.1 hypothetical protein CF335_g2865 [Tilletia laevis]KAE8247915.1 hypothetical protein A4X06_0g4090 [Tilletia controversa]
MKYVHANFSHAVHTRADHRAGAPIRVQRLRSSDASPTDAPQPRASSSAIAVQPITIALPSDVGLGGKGHGPNFVGTVILDGPGRKPLAPIPVVAIVPHLSPTRGHGSHSQDQDQNMLDPSSTAVSPDLTDGAIIPTATAASEAVADPSWNSNQPTPVVVALSAAGVILLMLIAFMIGVCLCRRYANFLDRSRSLPAFLRRRSAKKPVVIRKDTASSLDKRSIHSSPMPEKDEDGFETRFFMPSSLNRRPDRKAEMSMFSETTTLPHKEIYSNAPSKAISSVARGLAISRATGMAITMPPALRYEDIIASPVIASPSAIFSPDMNTLSGAHSPREVQRWTSFPVAPGGGTLTGRLIPDTGSARNSPLIGWSPNLRVTNMGSAPSSRLSHSDTSAPTIGLGFVEDGAHRMRSANTSGPTTSYYTEHTESGEVHEDDIQDFAMTQARRSISAPSIVRVEPEVDEPVEPVPSLSIETLQHMTWRDVPEGSLRTGSPLRVGSCDNLAAISASSSGMSFIGHAAVPQSVLRALEGATAASEVAYARSKALERVQSELAAENETGRREIPQPRRSGRQQHGVSSADTTTSLSSLNRRQIDAGFPLPESRYPQLRPELNRTASNKSDDLIILSGIAMDGISPIDMPHFPFSLWSSSASAPALASYAATLATNAANGVAAAAAHFPGGGGAPITTAHHVEPIRTNTLNTTPQKSMTAIPTTNSTTLSPSLSQMSKSSSAHSVLLLREQRLRSNLEALKRAESEESSLSLSPIHALGHARGLTGSSPSSSSFSLARLSIREPSGAVASGSPRKTRHRNITPTTAVPTTILPNASFTSEPRSMIGGGGGGGDALTTFAPSSCGSTPASSRSMDTLDTRASSPTPAPLGYSYSPDNRKANEISALAAATERDLVVQRAEMTVGGGYGNVSPVLTFLPSTMPARAFRERTTTTDGATLALQEKEQQRMLAQHLLAAHHQYQSFAPPASVQMVYDELVAALQEEVGQQQEQQQEQQQQDEQGAHFGPVSSSFSQSFYSQPSAAPSPSPRHNINQTPAGPVPTTASNLNAANALALRDSTNSLSLPGLNAFRFSGGGGGGLASGAPSERGSYVSPTLKLFQFYSSTGAGTGPTGTGTGNGNQRRSTPSSSAHDSSFGSSSGSGSGSGLGLGLVGMQPHRGAGSVSPTSVEEGGMGGPNKTQPCFARPAVRADGVVDVFCAA